MRGNQNRLNRLKDEVESLTAKMREAAEEEEEEEAAAKRANDMYEKILVHNAEIERLRTEARQIQAGEAQPIHTAADVAKVIEELRGNYEARSMMSNCRPRPWHRKITPANCFRSSRQLSLHCRSLTLDSKWRRRPRRKNRKWQRRRQKQPQQQQRQP